MKTKLLLSVIIALFIMQYTSASTTDNGSGVKLDGGIWYTTWVQITSGDGHNTQNDKNNLDINLSYPSNKVDFQFKTGGTTTKANRKMYLDIYTGSWVENHYTATVSKDKTFYDFSSSLPTNATAIAFRSYEGSSKRFVRNIKVHMAPHTKTNTSSIAFSKVPVGTTATQTVDFYSFLSGSNGIQISVVNESKQAITIPGLSLNRTSIGKNECEKINENAYSITVTFKPQSIISYSKCYIRITNSGASIGSTIDIPITTLSSALSAPTLSLQSNGTGYEVVYLQWNAITGAKGYNLYDNGTKIGTYTGTTATVTGLAMGSNHKYTVTTLAGTSESNHSNTINVTTNVYPKTSSVTFSNVQQNQFTINWNKVNITAKDHKFNRYQIHIYYYDYYDNWTHFQNVYVTDNNQTSYIVTGVDDATKYDVYVGVDFQYTVNGSTKSFDVASIGTQWVNNNVTTTNFVGSRFDGVQIYKGEWHRIEAGISHEMGTGKGCQITLKEYPCENLQYKAWVEEEGNVNHYIEEDATNIKYTLCGKNEGHKAYLEGNKFQTPIKPIKPEYVNINFKSSRGFFGDKKVYVSDMYAKIAPHIKIKTNAYINAQYPYIPFGRIRLNGESVTATINFQSFLVFNELKVTSTNPKFKLSKSVIAPATTSKAGTFCKQGETKYDFTITFTPDELGSHSSRITITDGVNSIAFTVDATVYSKNRLHVAGDWNNSSNWFFGVPATTEDVEIAAAVTIPNGYTAIANNISIESGGSISITPQGKLKANNIIGANTSNLTLQADESGTATLLFKNSDKIGATVQLYSLASSDGLRNGTPGNFKDPKWQYLGVNVESIDYNTLNPDGKTNWIYRWDETKHSTSCWVEKLKTGATLSAWTGYGLAQEKDTTYTYSGTLVNGDHTYNLTCTNEEDTNGDKGNNLITNSYTAPIDITTLTTDNFTNAEASIAIYNTGSYVEWKNQTNPGDHTPGTTTIIPVYNANAFDAKFRTIASSQAFFVRATGEGATFTVNYDRNVYNATQTNTQKRTKGDNNDPNVLKIMVANATTTDYLYLIENSNTTSEFDNGYDAKKIFDNPTGMQIYATTAFGYASVNTDTTLNGQSIGFVADSEYELYTMTFDTEKMHSYDKLYLYDSMTETYVDLLTEEIYQFYGSVEPMDNRFIITGERKNTSFGDTTTSTENVTWDDILAMNETIYLYSTTGQLISTLTTNSLYDLSIPAGIYIIRCGDKTLKIVNK